jgi:drug/metabolite transporter (DMT)-like permease
MLFIVLSVVQSVLIFVTFRLFERYKVGNLQAIVVNYIIASMFGFLINPVPVHITDLTSFSWFNSALLLGVLFIGTFFMFALSSQKAGVAVTSVTSKMSLVIPIIISVLFWGESLNFLRVAGIIMALLAFYLTFRKKGPIQWKAKYTYLPFLVFAGNGLVDTTMKYADHYHIEKDQILFLALVFSTAFIIGAVFMGFQSVRGKIRIRWRDIAGGVFLGLINFGSTYYMLKAISVFESSVVFPVTNAAIVGLSGIVGYFGFRERLSWINWMGILLAVTAILIIANA